MWQVRFRPQVSNYLESYIDKYQEVFFELYKDSGLWCEKELIKYYQKRASFLHQKLVDAINDRLKDDLVAGRNIKSNSIVLNVLHRRIMLKYTEAKDLTRWVESISIHYM